MSDSREKYLELMHAELDETASDKELATLREYLATNPEAQRLRAELAELANLLHEVEQVETPADLHASILAALPPQRRNLETDVRRSSRWRLRFPLIHYGYALAAGLILGVVLTGATLWNLSPSEKTNISGTMAARQNASQSVRTEETRIAVPELQGSVGLSRSGSTEKVEFDLKSEVPVEVEIQFDGSQVGLQGFSQLPNTIRRLQAEEGKISFQSRGNQRSTVLFANEKNAPAVLDLKFYVGGSRVDEGTLRIPGPSEPLK